MKVEREQDHVLIPKAGMISTVMWHVRDFNWVLARVEPVYLMRERLASSPPIHGKPHMYAYVPLRDWILLFPIPNEDGELIIRYFPPEVQI